jgi:hypothetical protein
VLTAILLGIACPVFFILGFYARRQPESPEGLADTDYYKVSGGTHHHTNDITGQI